MLINCVAYYEGRKLADLDIEEISDYLEKPGCFVCACSILYLRFRRMGWL